jgi:argonaute-like protein implicated in RNA metabolism and viral defense
LDQEIDEGSEIATGVGASLLPFHDVLKAEGMRLGLPIQMVRPSTYSGERKRKKARRGLAASIPLQDEATRAWNIHTALYYKGGGIPWRLLRSAADLTACFVGVSFYRTIQGDRLLTSVAQVFNERGEGVIVKGAQAQLDKDDRQPHLSEDDARLLLNTAIDVYRREHRTSPARLVVHKTSKMTDDEVRGFRLAADEQQIDVVDLVSVRRSLTRLFRGGTYPPLRGTFLTLQESTGLLYLRGSVNFFETYPGMYVPRPLEFFVAQGETTLEKLACEMLSLSKLNWNNTQFDGGEPITVRAARRVGDILKCVPEGGPVQPSFRFYM